MGKNRRTIQQKPIPQPKLISQTPQQLNRRLSIPLKLDDEDTSVGSLNSPKHIPLPDIPRLEECTFEFFMFLFNIICLGLQYLNLYRTVFWLPQSYTKYAMHFHLIDKGLVYFIVTLLSRRLLWSILSLTITKLIHQSYWKISLLIARIIFMVCLGGVLGALFFCITSQFNLARIIAVFYPFIFYVFNFKLDTSAFLEVIPTPIYTEEMGKINKNGKKPSWCVRAIQHACACSAEGARAEAAFLRHDCNRRLAQLLFHTVLSVHYTALLPCIFVPSSLHYDDVWLKVHTFFLATTTFLWHFIYCFPARYCDVLHRSSLHLGGWSRLESRVWSASVVPFSVWSSTSQWPQGAHVRHNKEFYRASGFVNAAEPGNSAHARLYALFSEPWRPQLVLVLCCTSLSVLQLAFVVTLQAWQQVLATAFVLFATDAALFVLLRDFLVLKRVYTYEQKQQGKATQ